MKILVVARNKVTGEKFLSNHKALSDGIELLFNQSSYFACINALLGRTEDEVVCLVHDDVILPPEFGVRSNFLIRELEENWPNWGLVGNAAVGALKQGYLANQLIRYLSDSHGGPNLVGPILPAQSVDGNLMLLNLKAMRSRALKMPDFKGFHLYDIALSIECQCAGLAVLVAPQLSCWHGSGGNQYEFDQASQSASWSTYLSDHLENKQILTLNGEKSIPLKKDSTPFAQKRTDLVRASLRNAAEGRKRRSVGIVIRTQLRRRPLLLRALDSIRSFIAASGNAVDWHVHIVTDSREDAAWTGVDEQHVLRVEVPQERDSRFLLVKHAASAVETEFLWFIDDDDWLFPNVAEDLAWAIACAPPAAMIFIDSQHYLERSGSDPDEISLFKSTPGSYFHAADFFKSTSGVNHSPFCGVLYARELLGSIPSRLYESVIYYEDFATTMYSLFEGCAFPLVLDRLCVGISVRESGNTITETDRTIWNKSMSTLASAMVNDSLNFQALSLGEKFVLREQIVNDDRLAIAQQKIDSLAHEIEAMLRSRSWRMTRPIRWFSDIGRYIVRGVKSLAGR